MADDDVQRDLSPVGLYSHASEVASNLPQMKGTPQQFAAMLTKQGVKPDELKHSGYDQAFGGQKMVTRDQLAQHFKSKLPKVQETVLGGQLKSNRYQVPGGGPYTPLIDTHTGQEMMAGMYGRMQEEADRLNAEESGKQNFTPSKYHQYQLPGGKNYREVLLHLPTPSPGQTKSAFTVEPDSGGRFLVRNTYNNELAYEGMTEDEARGAAQRLNVGAGKYADTESYHSSHWDTPNVLAHLRMSDRKGPKGEKILHLEELQSDWAQEGRKKGFRQPVTEDEIKEGARILGDMGPNTTPEEHARYQDIARRAHGVPAAPYVDSTQKWLDLGLKRVLHEAAKGGYDKLVVTPGQEQADRYDLSKHVSAIHVHDNPSSKNLDISLKHKGGDWADQISSVPYDKLDAHVGKDLATKIHEDRQRHTNTGHGAFSKEYNGVDLKVGGEGMKAFYDKLLPAALEKLAKKHDPQAKVAMHSHQFKAGKAANPWHVIANDGDNMDESIEQFANEASARRYAQRMRDDYGLEGEPYRVEYRGTEGGSAQRGHSLAITPEMRKSILRGQPAYAAGGEVTAQPQLAPVESHPARIPTRLVTSKKGISEPHHAVDMESFRADPKLFAKNMELVRAYPNMRESVARKADHEQLATEFIRHAKDNLLALHDAVPEEVRGRSKLWYKGARNIIDKWSKDYNLPDHSVAGAIAALSPQKDWYQNVSLAKRIMDVMRGSGGNYYHGFAMSPEMEAKFKGTKSLRNYRKTFQTLQGKTLADIDRMEDVAPEKKLAMKALWVRLHDEAHNERSHQIVSPEGEFGENVKTKSGAESGTGWGSLTEIGKAIAAIEAAKDPGKLSGLMGERHKVRNFYNNMLDPDAPQGDVTIDTHAVAAALYRALSGNSKEVSHNFGNYAGKGVPSAGSSAITGVGGLYPLYAEAYRQAAKERGIKPREMQSITWEAIRGLYPDTFKTDENNDKIDNVWLQYRQGKISQKRAREKIHAIAGRIRNPSWFAGDDEGGGHPAYTGELPRAGLRGSPPEGTLPRARGRTPGDVPTGAPRSASSSPGSQIGLISPEGLFAKGGNVDDPSADPSNSQSPWARSLVARAEKHAGLARRHDAAAEEALARGNRELAKAHQRAAGHHEGASYLFGISGAGRPLQQQDQDRRDALGQAAMDATRRLLPSEVVRGPDVHKP